MVTRALVVIGPVTLLLGIVQASAGLTAVGGLWTVLSFAFVWHRRRAQAEADRIKARRERDPDPPAEAPMSARTFLIGTILLLLAGVPALAVGLWQWGIEDSAWRWLPLAVGGALTAFALLSGLMYAVGSGITAAAGPTPTVPARLVIVSMDLTGLYVNNQPRVEFEFDVTPEGGSTYRVTKKATVPLTALGTAEVGRGFEALVVGPEDPTTMDIDWSSPLPAAAVGTLSDRLRELDELRDQGLVTPDEYTEKRQRLLDTL